MSAGLEHEEDLIDDVEQPLAASMTESDPLRRDEELARRENRLRAEEWASLGRIVGGYKTRPMLADRIAVDQIANGIG